MTICYHRVGMLALLVLTLTSDAGAEPGGKAPFGVPKGWSVGVGETRGVLIERFARKGYTLTAPELRDGEFCRIWIAPPFDAERTTGLKPSDVLELMYAGDATLDPVEGKDRHGKPTARFEFTHKVDKAEVHTLIHVREDRNGTWLILFQANSEALRKKHLPRLEAVLDGWDTSTPFPSK